MAKTLVIKGADFNTNKLDTVTFEGEHTSQVTLSQNTISASAIGATTQLTASVIPLDSIDGIYWASSDTNVATVSQTGLVTIAGAGTCNITATSGTVTATCAVTCEVVLSGFVKATHTYAYPPSTSNDITGMYAYPTDSWYTAYCTALDVDDEETKLLVDYLMTTDTSASATVKPVGSRPTSYKFGWVVPIPLAPNTSKIRVTSLDATFKSIVMYFKKNVASEYCGGYVASRKPTGTWSGSTSTDIASWPWETGPETEFDIPSGYDSVIVMWKLDAENSPFSDFNNATDAQMAEFTITCC